MSTTTRCVSLTMTVAALALSTACSVEAPGSATPAASTPAAATNTTGATTGAGSSDATGAATGGAAGSPAVVTGPASMPKVDESKPLAVAFFGAARANSFAQAAWSGVESVAKEHNATAEFFDGKFDAQVQAAQIQDAVTAGRFQVFVVSANDGTALIPAVEQAVAAGITVVVEFAPLGTRYDTAEPQVPGTVTVIDVPTQNGKLLGELGVEACKKVNANPCKVAYLEGFKALPLDNARTEAVKSTLTAGGAQVVASVEGGYTNESGRKAMQDVLQSNPDVNVVIGSSQAIAGAEAVAGARSTEIAWVANGGSRQAVQAVRDGRWFGAVCAPERTAGATAAAVGLTKARGGQVPDATTYTTLSPVGMKCTAQTADQVEGEYDE